MQSLKEKKTQPLDIGNIWRQAEKKKKSRQRFIQKITKNHKSCKTCVVFLPIKYITITLSYNHNQYYLQ